MVNTNTLSQLSQLGKQLNSSSDSVNTAIDALNDELREINLGVRAWVKIADSGLKWDSVRTQKYCYLTSLGFCRIEDQWQLAINEQRIDYVPDPDDRFEVNEVTEDDYTPLLRASRELRITAIEHFDELLDKLKTEADRTLAAVERAKELATRTET